ncbi:hypothetical protein REPUB_Repub10bG0185300 [Reevesia pubescens]
MEDLLFHCSANHARPLSPVNFLERAANVYGDKVSIVYDKVSFSWRETHERCLRLASSLSGQLGLSRGDTVSSASSFLIVSFKFLMAFSITLENMHGDGVSRKLNYKR